MKKFRRKRLGTETKFIDDIRARQNNTVWPDLLASSRRIDEFLLKGPRDASVIQRIGTAIFGAGSLFSALLLLYAAHENRSFLITFISAAMFLLAAGLFRNAFRKRR